MSGGVIAVESERVVQRIVKLVQDEINTLTGQLLIATQTAINPDIPGSRRQRAEKAMSAIPQQLEDMKTFKAAAIQTIEEMRSQQ